MNRRRAGSFALGSALVLSALAGAAAVAGSSHSVHSTAGAQMLQQRCRALMATFDGEIARVSESDAARQARRLRAKAEGDCFAMDASADNTNYGVHTMERALARIAVGLDRSP
jgi:hypothetical protein